jgi:LysR family hydrogen peroxide-inducible transcriptional activator
VIELRQLAALIAVGEHGGFSAAAKALFTVQSNVSAHIQHLERELGVTLVDRSAGVLTQEGTVVADRARRVFGEIDAIKLDVVALGGEVAGDVRVGVIGTTARWLVPGVLVQLRTHHPRVRAVVVEASTSSLIPQLMAGRLDLAVTNLPVDVDDLEVQQLFAEEMLLVVPLHHELAHRDRVTFGELDGIPLLLSAPGTALREELDIEARRAGVTLVAQAEIDGVRLMASLVFGGFGAAILPATAVPGWLSGDWVRVQVRRRGLPSAPARALSDVLRAVVADQGQSQPGLHLLIPENA